MSTIFTLLRSLRRYWGASILTPLFIIGEVIFECLIPLIMVSLVDKLDGHDLGPVVHSLPGLRYSLSPFCGHSRRRSVAKPASGHVF